MNTTDIAASGKEVTIRKVTFAMDQVVFKLPNDLEVKMPREEVLKAISESGIISLENNAQCESGYYNRSSGQAINKNRDLSGIATFFGKMELKFGGRIHEDVEDFIQYAEELARISAVSGTELLLLLPVSLEDSALQFYRVEREYWNSWEDCKTALRNYYRPYSYELLIGDEIRERMQGEDEPVRDYIVAIRELYQKLPEKPSEEIIKQRLYRNLKDELRSFMAPLQDLPLDEFIARMIAIDNVKDRTES